MPINIRFEPVLPGKDYPLDVLRLVERNLTRYMKNQLGKELQGKFEDTVEGWSSPPSFPIQFSTPRGTRLQIYVGPKGKGTTNWIRVNKGTGPRPIVPKDPNAVMVFPIDYAPKTTPSGKYGGPGTKSGPIARTKVVGVHQIAAREFEKKIATMQWISKVSKDIQEVIDTTIAKYR